MIAFVAGLVALTPFAAGQSPVADLEALRAEVRAQRVLLQEQQSRYEALEARRLQTASYVSVDTFNSEVATLKQTQYSMGGAMDSAWLCLCGALVMFMHAGFCNAGDRQLPREERIQCPYEKLGKCHGRHPRLVGVWLGLRLWKPR